MLVRIIVIVSRLWLLKCLLLMIMFRIIVIIGLMQVQLVIRVGCMLCSSYMYVVNVMIELNMYRQVIVVRLLREGQVVGCLLVVRFSVISIMLLQSICLVVVMNGLGRFSLCVQIDLNVQLIGVISSRISFCGEVVRLLFVLSQIMLRKLIVMFSYLLWLVCWLCMVVNSVIYNGIDVIVVVVSFEDIVCLVSIIMLLFSISMVSFMILRLCYCCWVGVGMLCQCSIVYISELVMMKCVLDIVVSGSVLFFSVSWILRQVDFQIM